MKCDKITTSIFPRKINECERKYKLQYQQHTVNVSRQHSFGMNYNSIFCDMRHFNNEINPRSLLEIYFFFLFERKTRTILYRVAVIFYFLYLNIMANYTYPFVSYFTAFVYWSRILIHSNIIIYYCFV